MCSKNICYDKFIIGTKCITLADDVFNEHFPGYPIFPGSLVMEGLAQLAGSFFEIMMKEKKLIQKRSVMVIVNKMKFRKTAVPGDKLMMRADIDTMRDDYGVAAVKAICDGELCVEGKLTFSFVDVPDKKLQESREEMYNICMKNVKVIEDESDI